MNRDLRENILAEAKRQFSQKGYNGVSIGDIAAELGISKGNLTYYFRKKEEIIEALLEAPQDKTPPGAPHSLEELMDFLKDMQEVIEDNRFYFMSHAQFGQISEKIHLKQKQVYQINHEKLMEGFAAFRDQGIFKEEISDGEYASVADTLLLDCIYWLPFNQLRYDPGEKSESYMEHGIRIINYLMKEPVSPGSIGIE